VGQYVSADAVQVAPQIAALAVPDHRDFYVIDEQPAPAPTLAQPSGLWVRGWRKGVRVWGWATDGVLPSHLDL